VSPTTQQVFDKYAESQADGSPSVKISKLGEAFANAGYSVSKEVLSRVILRYGDRKGHLWLGKFISAAVRLESQFCKIKTKNTNFSGGIGGFLNISF